jgi:hypothetical protein
MKNVYIMFRMIKQQYKSHNASRKKEFPNLEQYYMLQS